ncbi:MAG TPA: hypothetical protein VGO70_09630 [Arsenicitalea sp.]|jgi:hypothetical protein|nr:hypothetical protein [Arsenicitalea sp.]
MTFLNDLSFSQLLTRLGAYLIIVGCHGFVLAALADALGDREPAFIGRRTLSPFVQLSVPGLLSSLLFHIGWMKPLAIDHRKLRWGRGGLLVLVGVSLAVLLVLVVLLNPLRVVVTGNLTGTAAQSVLGVVQEVQQQAVWYVLVNLLPIPGLTGGLWLQAAAPKLAAALARYHLAFALGLLLLAVIGVLDVVLGPLYFILANQLIVLIS